MRDCHLGNKVEGYDQQVSRSSEGLAYLPVCQHFKKPPRCPICSRICIFHDLSESWQIGKTHSHSGQMLARILAKWQEPQNQWGKLGKQIRGHLLLQLTAWQWDRATAPTTAFLPYTRDSVFSRSCNQGLRYCVPVVSCTCSRALTPSGKAISAGGRRARPSGQEVTARTARVAILRSQVHHRTNGLRVPRQHPSVLSQMRRLCYRSK